MEDARLAEVLLAKLRRYDFDEQLRVQTISGLTDGVLVSALQLVNGFLTIRDRNNRAADAQAQAYEKVRRLETKNKELAEEMERRAEAAEREQAAMEADRDAWRDRTRDAEGKLAHEVICSKAAEAKELAAVRGREAVQKINEELTERLSTAVEQVDRADARVLAAEEKANKAWSRVEAAEAQLEGANKRADEAEGRARRMEERVRRAEEWASRSEERARQAEERADQTDGLNKELSHAVREASNSVARAEEEAKKADAARLLVAAQLWDAEARLEEAEGRAWRAEAESADRVKKAVDGIMQSPAYVKDLEEAAADAYLKGFADCKAQMTLAYNLEGAEAILPGDLDAPEASGTDADMGEASGAEEEDANDALEP